MSLVRYVVPKGAHYCRFVERNVCRKSEIINLDDSLAQNV